ncbi:hypothetical protein PENSPDRAFT_108617 [Peniophora sp. CONT]|nr:hypothetical protein PENSPDRAFT_108617 [Peniophora sp. CONT]
MHYRLCAGAWLWSAMPEVTSMGPRSSHLRRSRLRSNIPPPTPVTQPDIASSPADPALHADGMYIDISILSAVSPYFAACAGLYSWRLYTGVQVYWRQHPSFVTV